MGNGEEGELLSKVILIPNKNRYCFLFSVTSFEIKVKYRRFIYHSIEEDILSVLNRYSFYFKPVKVDLDPIAHKGMVIVIAQYK